MNPAPRGFGGRRRVAVGGVVSALKDVRAAAATVAAGVVIILGLARTVGFLSHTLSRSGCTLRSKHILLYIQNESDKLAAIRKRNYASFVSACLFFNCVWLANQVFLPTQTQNCERGTRIKVSAINRMGNLI
jgi:hypothetical protein